jgi:hypothetical protein
MLNFIEYTYCGTYPKTDLTELYQHSKKTLVTCSLHPPYSTTPSILGGK